LVPRWASSCSSPGFFFGTRTHAETGWRWWGVGAAFILIFLPFTLPPLILARKGRWLVLAAVLAAAGAVAYFTLWLELLDELHLPS
jgi:hypothetical protein